MVKSDTFHLLQDLSHAVRGCLQLSAVSESGTEKENTQDSCQLMRANITACVHASPKTDREVVR